MNRHFISYILFLVHVLLHQLKKTLLSKCSAFNTDTVTICKTVSWIALLFDLYYTALYCIAFYCCTVLILPLWSLLHSCNTALNSLILSLTSTIQNKIIYTVRIPHTAHHIVHVTPNHHSHNAHYYKIN